MTEESNWIVKERNYELDKVKYFSQLTNVQKDQDPLRVELSNIELIKKKKQLLKKANKTLQLISVSTNPLEDPLSIKPNQPQSNNTQKKENSILPYNAKVVEDFKQLQYSLIVNQNFNVDASIEVNWQALKKNLNDLFCNNFEMEVKSMYNFDFGESMQKNYKIEKGKNRMDQLETTEDVAVVTAGQFVKKIEEAKKEMLLMWSKEERVKALIIIVQCMKMLNDVSTPKFYCHKFLLISDILDNFSKLVFERISKIAFGNKEIPDFSSINPSIGNQNSKDVCMNWIMKTCCIRELLPRIYIDISFLGMFKFIMTDEELELKIISLSEMIRGISHPLIAFYAAMYMTKSILILFPKNKKFLLILLKHLASFEIDEKLMKKLNYENMTVDELKKVIDPCIEWIVYCLSKNMQNKDFKNLMKIYDESKSYSLLKGAIIHSLPKFLFNEQIIQYIFVCLDLYNDYESSFLCYLISQKILITNNPLDGKFIAIMWDKIKNCKNHGLFVDCCSLLAEILIKFHSEDVQDKFFEEVFEIFKNTFSTSAISGESQEEVQKYFAKFEIFLYNILTKISNYNSILSGDNFLFLLENFKPEMKLNICNTIFNQIINQKEPIRDTYLAFSLLKIGKIIHDSIEIFSPENKKKEVADLLIKFIQKINFGMDFENYLNFLTEARSAYSELESVAEVLIKEVQKTAIQTYKSVKGKHTKKTMRFSKVCIAYCQITVPSISDTIIQLKLLLTTGHIALVNNLISECDSIMKHILSGIQKIIVNDLNKFTADFIVNYTKSLLGFLILVPSNPDDPFQFIRAFTNIFNSESLFKTNLVSKVKLPIFCGLVKFLSTQLQNRLPYHIFNVDSNDEIFTADPRFIAEGNELIESIIGEILSEIAVFDSKLTAVDYDDFEFMIATCGDCIEIFKYNFLSTTYQVNVINKMLEILEKYIDNLSGCTSYGIKQKISKYKAFYEQLKSS